MIVKEEQLSSPEHSEQIIDSNGIVRRYSPKKREKIIVGPQPRNANGTFAPSASALEEEQALAAQAAAN